MSMTLFHWKFAVKPVLVHNSSSILEKRTSNYVYRIDGFWDAA